MKLEIYTCLLLFIAISCKPSKDRLIVWELVDSYEEKNDTCLFRMFNNGDTTIFEYDFDFDNFADPLTFKLLKDSSLLIGENDFLKPKEIIKSYVNKMPIEILRYELPYSPPGGQGCFLFNFELGMLCNGLYIGEKLIVKNHGELFIETDSIAKLMRLQLTAPPPPSAHEDYGIEGLSDTEKAELEEEIKDNAP